MTWGFYVIMSVPLELWCLIFSHLTPFQLWSVRAVCRQWSTLAIDVLRNLQRDPCCPDLFLADGWDDAPKSDFDRLFTADYKDFNLSALPMVRSLNCLFYLRHAELVRYKDLLREIKVVGNEDENLEKFTCLRRLLYDAKKNVDDAFDFYPINNFKRIQCWFTLRELHICRADIYSFDGLELCEKLEVVKFRDCSVQGGDWEMLGHLPSMKKFYWTGAGLTTAHFATWPPLEELDIGDDDSEWDDDCPTTLSLNLSKMTNLDLFEAPLVNIDVLQNAPKLRRLSLIACEDAGFIQVDGLNWPVIEELIWADNKDFPELFRGLTTLKKLTAHILSHEELKTVLVHSSVTDLTLEFYDDILDASRYNFSVKVFETWEHLRALELVNIDIVTDMPCLQCVEDLTLDTIMYQEDTGVQVPPNLKRFRFNRPISMNAHNVLTMMLPDVRIYRHDDAALRDLTL